MVDYDAFSSEICKIAEKRSRKENLNDVLRHSVAAAAGTAAGIAMADFLVHTMKKRNPQAARAIHGKAIQYGVPALLGAGSMYASHKYKKNINDAVDRFVREQ